MPFRVCDRGFFSRGTHYGHVRAANYGAVGSLTVPPKLPFTVDSCAKPIAGRLKVNAKKAKTATSLFAISFNSSLKFSADLGSCWGQNCCVRGLSSIHPLNRLTHSTVHTRYQNTTKFVRQSSAVF